MIMMMKTDIKRIKLTGHAARQSVNSLTGRCSIDSAQQGQQLSKFARYWIRIEHLTSLQDGCCYGSCPAESGKQHPTRSSIIYGNGAPNKWQFTSLLSIAIPLLVPYFIHIGVNRITYRSQGVASLPHKCQPPPPSDRQHPSYGDCLKVKREYYQNCSALGWVTQCSQSAAHLCEQFLQVQQIRFVTFGPLRHA